LRRRWCRCGHFRYGGALELPPVKLLLGLFFPATPIGFALSGRIREGWPGPRKFYLCFALLPPDDGLV
jgi:hypothetical protein